MRKHVAALLVAVVLVGALFAAGFVRPAKAATAPTRVTTATPNAALVCLWLPLLNIGLC